MNSEAEELNSIHTSDEFERGSSFPLEDADSFLGVGPEGVVVITQLAIADNVLEFVGDNGYRTTFQTTMLLTPQVT